MLDCDGDHGIGRGQSGHGTPIQFCHGLLPPPAKKQNFFSVHFPNFCDYFVKKVVYEIRKCHLLHEDFDPLKFRLHVERVTLSAREYNGQGGPLYARADMVTRSTCSLSFALCDNFVQKLVSEMRKCHHLQRDVVPLTTSL